jgi:hypothetical protein
METDSLPDTVPTARADVGPAGLDVGHDGAAAAGRRVGIGAQEERSQSGGADDGYHGSGSLVSHAGSFP